MRTQVVRSEVQRLLREVPFRPFVLSLENGDRLVIEHPENIAFNPVAEGGPGSEDFYVIASSLRVFSTFAAVSSVSLLDSGDGT